MENKQCPSKKLISIQEEKFVRQVDYDTIEPRAVSSRVPQKELHLEIFHKKPSFRQGQLSSSQRVLVSIKPRNPAIKTLYIAEKNRFRSKKGSEKSRSRSRLGIGDHSSLNSSVITTYYSQYTDVVSTCNCEEQKGTTTSVVESGVITSTTDLEKSAAISICEKAEQKPAENSRVNIYNEKLRPAEKCYVYTQPQFSLNLPKVEAKAEKSKYSQNKTDIATLIITKTSSDDNVTVSLSTIRKLSKRIDHLEKKLIRQEMVIHSLDPNLQGSSSEEDECKEARRRDGTDCGRPGCSYIQQYSHIPETSAFQRYAQQGSSLSASKATTLEKERNSEKYGRDFTTYDGITTRGRRQSASVPCKRGDFPQMAAERVHKIRHKLNPVRDYRLMDTVHFLAQGEFAPRDDGIKLTPSREAVLSDIIWEDVCRTHWPNARLGRRGTQPERCNTRCELQRLIDSLLRERVAHVERRRRRHYRIVKLNHRHESCRPVGKTGDIIVASHKKKDGNEDRNITSEHNTASAMISNRRWEESNQSSRKSHRSYDRMNYEDSSYHHKRRVKEDECVPGPSYVSNRRPSNREPMCCYHSVSPAAVPAAAPAAPAPAARGVGIDMSSSSNCSKPATRSPRLVVRKDAARSRRHKEEPNLEQYILLPTLVIRTPSNVKRQKKFNELYHRILNIHTMNCAQECAVATEAVERNPLPKPDKKDIGLNINIIQSEENIKKK
ncbi:hypothetical protein O0L34_g5927 [Tuta absoluta]|nr:hypothetical protein O0L34_g5927 [Tuta absoluta]